jgi:hypothetical protein
VGWRVSVQGAVQVALLVTVSVVSAPDGAHAARAMTALDVLATIPIERERGAGYDRSLFPHWLDVDGDGCNAREQVLKRDSVTLPQVDPVDCFVYAGDWVSPYDGMRISDRSAVDIDHVVALKEAWDSGAWAWSTAMRTAFANDTSDRRSLVAASASSNRSKGDKDPTNWLPPRKAAVCGYLADWVAIKARWRLSMDPSEHGRIRNVLTRSCAGQRIMLWPALPVSASRPAVPNQTGSTSTTPEPGRAPTIFPGAWCTPVGARGVSAAGVTYVCATSNASGVPYSDGRTRWRRG